MGPQAQGWRMSRAGENTQAMEAVSMEGWWQPCNESKPKYL